MRLTIFGASGKTGRHLVEQALAAGHHVTAYVRDPDKLDVTHNHLHVMQGDTQQKQGVQAAVAGADAVISVLGPSHNRPTYDISLATANLIDAMEDKRVRRLVVSTGAGVGDEHDRPGLVDRIITSLLRLSAGNVLRDMLRTAQAVRASDLDWTIVRVPRLTDDAPTGRTRAGYLGNGVGPRLARADMASFMLNQVADRQYLRQSPVVSN
jgi:putative NADH-flavin reductase